MKRILIAPNSFKNSLTAEEVADAIASGLKDSGIDAELICFPIADGGDHTSALLRHHLNGQQKTMEVHGAYLAKTEAAYVLINNGKTAIVDISETSGFKSIKQHLQSPMISSSIGLGEVIRNQFEAGVRDFIVCLGGSVTVDGGIGMLQELGLRFKDAAGDEVRVNPQTFAQVETMELQGLEDIRSSCRFTVLCDVENRLLGDEGAARVFAPQKGASEEDIELLEEFLTAFDRLSMHTVGRSLDGIVGGGAAGGLGAALAVFLSAEIKPGAAYFCELTNFKAELEKADLLITGEGSIDEQSLQGKAPVEVARMAKGSNIPCIGLAGKVPLEVNSELQDLFLMLLAIGSQPESLEDAMQHTQSNLFRTAKQIGNMIYKL